MPVIAFCVRTQPHCTWNQSRSSLIEGSRGQHQAAEEAYPPAAKQRLRNRHSKSTLKTLFKQLEDEVAEGQTEEAQKTATFLTSRIDKAAAKGILHKNNAAHKKSRVQQTLTQLPS